MATKRGFTLIELLTVMAVTAILLAIIAVPIVQSFNITRATQGFAQAQDRARELVSRIEREVTNAAAVRDNTGVKGAVTVVVPDINGAPIEVLLPNSKLDLVRPAEGDPAARSGGAFVNPDINRGDPTLRAPKGQPVLPASQGDTIVRYVVGLKRPVIEAPSGLRAGIYNNPYVQFQRAAATRWLGTQSGEDNLYVLWRFQVPVYRWNLTTNVREVNTDLFEVDVNGQPVLDDPSFLQLLPGTDYTVATTLLTAAGTTKAQRIRRWLASGQIVTEPTRFDMIMPNVNRATNTVLFDGLRPSLSSLVRFQPTRVSNEPALSQMAVRPGEESANAEKIGPDVFRTQYGAWANVNLTIYPSLYPTAFVAGTLGAVRPAWGDPNPLLTVQANPTGGTSLYGNGTVELFDISEYERARSANLLAPFSRAVRAAATAAPWNENFLPVVPDTKSGQVVASFDVKEFGDPSSTVLPENNIPSNTGLPAAPGIVLGVADTPANPTYQTGPGWETFTTVNQRFNRLWHQWDGLWGGNGPAREGPQGVKRYIDLRAIQMNSGSISPLATFASGVGRVQITPGSEVVVGPDQNPGPNYGLPVRYSRVPNVDAIPVGPNQYKINYVDRPEPDWTQFGFAGPNYNPNFYDATDFLSAVVQPRFRAGYIELNSRYGEPIPAGNIQVTYRFQFTEPRDVVTVNYDSSELIEVVLTMRNYAQTTIPNPQMTTVRGSSKVRNFIR